MANMSNGSDYVTTNISLPEEDWKALKYLATEYKTSMAELVRQGVGVVLKKLAHPRYGSPEWWVKANLEAEKDFARGNFKTFNSADQLIAELRK